MPDKLMAVLMSVQSAGEMKSPRLLHADDEGKGVVEEEFC